LFIVDVFILNFKESDKGDGDSKTPFVPPKKQIQVFSILKLICH